MRRHVNGFVVGRVSVEAMSQRGARQVQRAEALSYAMVQTGRSLTQGAVRVGVDGRSSTCASARITSLP